MVESRTVRRSQKGGARTNCRGAHIGRVAHDARTAHIVQFRPRKSLVRTESKNVNETPERKKKTPSARTPPPRKAFVRGCQKKKRFLPPRKNQSLHEKKRWGKGKKVLGKKGRRKKLGGRGVEQIVLKRGSGGDGKNARGAITKGQRKRGVKKRTWGSRNSEAKHLRFKGSNGKLFERKCLRKEGVLV